MSFQTFKNKWLGKFEDYDGVYQYQCVDLIKRYLADEFALKPGAWGNAIDYWRAPNAALLKKFDKFTGSAAKEGDIVVLNGLPGNSYGHIGIATGGINSNQVEILEQNGSTGNGKGEGGDVIRTRYVDRARVAGLLRPKARGTFVRLAATAQTWRFYALSSLPVKANARGFLKPAKFGGLEYPVVELRDLGSTAVIDTQDYGRVKIWIRDAEATVFTK